MCYFSVLISYFERTNTNDENGEWGSHAVVMFKDWVLFLIWGLEIPSFRLRHNLFIKWRLKGIVARCAAVPRAVGRPTYKNLGAFLWGKQIMQGEWLQLDTVGQSNKPPLKEWRCLALDLGEKKVEQKCGVFCIDLISLVVLCGRYCYFTTGKKT